MTYSTLLFDLDGTISDPLVGIARCLNHALASFGFEERPKSELATCIGPPIDAVFARLARTDSKELVADLVARYRERFSDVGYSENRRYPGMAEVLQGLHDAGAVMAICTSKRADYAGKILRMFRIDLLFDFVDGGDVGIHKHEQIARLLEEGRISTRALMIGDRDVDLSAAQRNGLDSAGVLWGYGTEEELRAGNPAFTFATPDDLNVLGGLTTQRRS